MNHKSIIALFGGTRPLARALGHVNPTTVNYWATTGKIPRWRWHEILAAAKTRKIRLAAKAFNGSAK